MRLLPLAAATVLLLAACAGGAGSLAPTTRETASFVLAPPSLDVPLETPSTVSVIPDNLLDEILVHTSELSNVPVAELRVESAEAVTWPDGSLGCPEPGMMYTQVLVDGYRVVVTAGEKTYDFRGSGDVFRLCENTGDLPTATKEVPPPMYDGSDRY